MWFTSHRWQENPDAIASEIGATTFHVELGIATGRVLGGGASAGAARRSAMRSELKRSQCFVAGTLISTEEGLRPIEEIREGDLVWAQTEGDDAPKLQKVVQTFDREADELWIVDLDSGERIQTTAEHPFWVTEGNANATRGPPIRFDLREDENGCWYAASQLQPGDRLLDRNGQSVNVASVSRKVAQTAVYNFEVEHAHTYFVGETSVLVHNSCGNRGVSAARAGTYALRDPVTDQIMRTGRSNDLARRAGEHGRDPALRDLTFEPIHRTDVRRQQRGLEQILHDTHQPPLNKINPISPTNPRRQEYLDAADEFLNQ